MNSINDILANAFASISQQQGGPSNNAAAPAAEALFAVIEEELLTSELQQMLGSASGQNQGLGAPALQPFTPPALDPNEFLQGLQNATNLLSQSLAQSSAASGSSSAVAPVDPSTTAAAGSTDPAAAGSTAASNPGSSAASGASADPLGNSGLDSVLNSLESSANSEMAKGQTDLQTPATQLQGMQELQDAQLKMQLASQLLSVVSQMDMDIVKNLKLQ